MYPTILFSSGMAAGLGRAEEDQHTIPPRSMLRLIGDVVKEGALIRRILLQHPSQLLETPGVLNQIPKPANIALR